jgi:imidazolonepropionase-like amidohydrolase
MRPRRLVTRRHVLRTLSRALLVAPLLGSLPSATALAQPIAIVGGKVHPVSGPVIDGGTVIITGGRITAVGANLPLPVGAKVIDAKGKWVTPGLVNPLSSLGLTEVGGSVPDASDVRAQGEAGVAAAFRVWEGLNPDSVLWAPARNEGVTSVVAVPSGGLIAGQAAWLDTAGGTRAELVRRAPVAMAANLTASTVQAPSRGDLLLRLRQVLDDARSYATRKAAYERAATRPFVVSHIHLEALQPVLVGKLPLLVAINRAADIQALLELARDYRIRVIVEGGAEAWKVAGALAAAKTPVLTSALDNIPVSFDELGVRQENAALLRKAGVPVIITSGGREAFYVRNVRQHAGNAVAYGLAWDDALRAVTLAPAEAFGLGDTLGSLAAGKVANLVIWSGDPFEFSTRAEHVFVRGQEVQGTSRQDLLSERYKTPGK